MQYFSYLCSDFMDKRRVYHIIEWVVALAACGYLIYRLAIYEDYASLWATLSGMSWPQLGALLLCVALMPVNMSLEAWRWRTLIPMSWREAHRQVYYSKLAGLITPWRLGEYPARALLMSESPITNDQLPMTNRDLWSRVLSMGAVGSATMTTAIVIAGLGSLGILGGLGNLVNGTWWIIVGAVLLLLILALVFAPRLLRRWATVSHRLVLISIAQSFVRLACWCVQLYLVLFALGAIYHLPITIYQLPITNYHLPITIYHLPITIYQLPIYYLLITITPNVPIAEVGVRGAWAILVFGSVNAALAGVLLWIINTLLPCLIWPFLRKNEK